ncbi:hypothetical protein ACFFHZ_00820, partial [Brachybacterium muris]
YGSDVAPEPSISGPQRGEYSTLSDDPHFPVRAAHHGDDLASPMGTPDEPIPDTGQFLAVEERRSEGDGGAGSGPAGGGSHRAD